MLWGDTGDVLNKPLEPMYEMYLIINRAIVDSDKHLLCEEEMAPFN